jgi:hypothetical protein
MPEQDYTIQPTSPPELGTSLLLNGNVPAMSPLSNDKPDTANLSKAGVLLSLFNPSITSPDGSQSETLSFLSNMISTRTESFTATGSYSKEEQFLKSTFTYRYTGTDNKSGTAVATSKEFSFTIEARLVKENQTNHFTKKEDIFSFIRRIEKKLMDAAKHGDVSVSGIVLSPEDMQELATIEKGAMLQMLHLMVQSVNLAARIKHANTGQAPNMVTISPKRETTEGNQQTSNSSLDLKTSTNTSESISAAPEQPQPQQLAAA